MDNKTLSKIISHALRHEPGKYHLSLDDNGWVEISDLVNGINQFNKGKNEIVIENIEAMINESTKKRHEIKRNLIRAVYGHSTMRVAYKEVNPPDFLYHGTSPENCDSILEKGLLPMNRKYVHLSSSIDLAIKVGKRKTAVPIVLKIDTKKAKIYGVKFYVGKRDIYLSDSISSAVINIIKI